MVLPQNLSLDEKIQASGVGKGGPGGPLAPPKFIEGGQPPSIALPMYDIIVTT